MGQCLHRPSKVNPLEDNEGLPGSCAGVTDRQDGKSSRVGKKVTLPPLRNVPPRYRYDHKQSAKVKKKVTWNEKKLSTNMVEHIVLGAENTQEKEKQAEVAKPPPFWKVDDVPIKSVSLPSIEDIQNNMRSIESEMQALLKPEEKYLERSCAFTIGKMDTPRSKTPRCVPQRLSEHQKAQMDRVTMQEKQRMAERRRNLNIAKRIQSAIHRSTAKIAPEVVQEKEREHERKTQMKVDFKMKAAADRRNGILGQRAHAAKKEARTELVTGWEKEFAVAHKGKQELKMTKTNENRERTMRRKLRSLKFQDKKRQFARKRVASQKQEEEELCHTFVETETYDGDDDLGEHDWD